MIQKKQTPSISEANTLFLTTGLLLITIGFYAQVTNLYIGLLITEYLVVLLPTLLYFKIKEYPYKENLRLNKITLKQAIVIILIVIFSYPVAVLLNVVSITILSQFVNINPNPVPLPGTISEYIIGFLIISLTPGICEEVMFRGMIMSSYDRLGKKKAIIYSAIFFGLFHFNGQNLLVPIFMGIIFGIIVYKTNSLYSTIIAHTINNTIALTLGSLLNASVEEMESTVGNVPELAEIVLGVLLLVLGVLLCGYIAFRLIKILPEGNKTKETFQPSEISRLNGLSIIEKLPIILMVIIFIVWNYKIVFI